MIHLMCIISLDNVPSTNQTLHTFKSALTGAITRATVATGGDYKHKFVAPAQLTPTNANYDPSTGIMTLTVADHGLKNGTRIKVEDGFVTFTCDQDSDQTKHSYPRASDPYSDEWMKLRMSLLIHLMSKYYSIFHLQTLQLMHLYLLDLRV